MDADRLQQSRFELKYLINEDTALKVRDFVRCYLDFDEHSVGKPNCSYSVHSLYLDSDDLEFYRASIGEVKDRYKLRLRYYDANPDSSVFFEIRRQINNCILKQRAGVQRKFVAELLSGHQAEEKCLVTRSPTQMVALQRFRDLMLRDSARPVVQISFRREAYMGPDNAVRVTMDRDVRCEENLTAALPSEVKNRVTAFADNVILELKFKFTTRFPQWFRDLVRMANVVQCGATKYVESIKHLSSA